MSQFQILTVQQFIDRHQAACATLTEQEARIVAKTVIFLGLEYNESPAKAAAYLKNINAVQTAAVKKFTNNIKDLGLADEYQLYAFQKLGLL